MESIWYIAGAAVVVVIMCIGLYGMAVAKRTGRKRRRGRTDEGATA